MADCCAFPQVTTAHGSPERIARLKQTFAGMVERYPEAGALEWLDSKERIVEKMPQLVGAHIDVRPLPRTSHCWRVRAPALAGRPG